MLALMGHVSQSLTRISTPTLDDFDLSSQTGNLCVGLPSHVETVSLVGWAALLLGGALLLIGQVMKQRAAKRRTARFGPTGEQH